ncbi:MAG: hypothetical protein HS124_04675 [Anaerolineales bacterium]|nr:hypothetical protein [Anaerolineales bacterium]MCL4260309.1 hypothetical protein [Anaerolineales bacterium]
MLQVLQQIEKTSEFLKTRRSFSLTNTKRTLLLLLLLQLAFLLDIALGFLLLFLVGFIAIMTHGGYVRFSFVTVVSFVVNLIF